MYVYTTLMVLSVPTLQATQLFYYAPLNLTNGCVILYYVNYACFCSICCSQVIYINTQ